MCPGDLCRVIENAAIYREGNDGSWAPLRVKAGSLVMLLEATHYTSESYQSDALVVTSGGHVGRIPPWRIVCVHSCRYGVYA